MCNGVLVSPAITIVPQCNQSASATWLVTWVYSRRAACPPRKILIACTTPDILQLFQCISTLSPPRRAAVVSGLIHCPWATHEAALWRYIEPAVRQPRRLERHNPGRIPRLHLRPLLVSKVSLRPERSSSLPCHAECASQILRAESRTASRQRRCLLVHQRSLHNRPQLSDQDTASAEDMMR